MDSLLILLLLVAFALAVVASIVRIATRAKPVLTAPTCAVCDYDLRAANFISGPPAKCPECGADLSIDGAVRFGVYARKSRRGVLIAAAIMAGMLFLLFALTFVARSVARPVGPAAIAVASLTNAQILAQLPTTASQPWDWQELERRLAAGSLSQADVDAAFAIVTAGVKASTSSHPLNWSQNFVSNAISSGAVSPKALDAFVQTSYGNSAKVEMNAVFRQGKPLRLHLRGSSVWILNRVRPMWHLRECAIDGEAVSLLDDRNGKALAADTLSNGMGSDRVECQLLTKLPPGEHEITFTFDMGVIGNGATPRAAQGKWGTKDKWPSPITTWQKQEKLKFTVVPADQQIITLITDASRAPFADGNKAVRQLILRPGHRGPEMLLSLNPNPVPVAVVGKMSLRIAGKEYPCYQMVISAGESGGSFGYSFPAALPAADKADLIITPDTDLAERTIGIKNIWGQKIEIKDIPLERSDTPEESR